MRGAFTPRAVDGAPSRCCQHRLRFPNFVSSLRFVSILGMRLGRAELFPQVLDVLFRAPPSFGCQDEPRLFASSVLGETSFGQFSTLTDDSSPGY